MATLLLSAGGAAVGSLFGPVGTILGRAAGALAGYAIAQSLFGEERTVEKGRLADLHVQTSREGAPIPRVYGRVRISGEMIWATRFEEEVSETSEGGGKGGSSGTTVRSYSYFANFALALSEGPIARIGRAWADGKPFNLAAVAHRVHRGTGSQSADSLIEAKQGEGRAPAYRGTAYIVFERLPLERFGNRIPQLSFEVIRPVGRLEEKVTAVTLIPGATEFGYDPKPVRQILDPGHERRLNRHIDGAATDWEASLDELQALCPNLESVALVAAWFGDDLRASHCALKPGVTERDIVSEPEAWAAAGLSRATARLVSRHDGSAAYGGTPSDASLVRAIRDLNDRGLAVAFYPFVMMDIPTGNGLPDPYGGSEQGAYPWRGEITASIAPGRPGTPDKTAAAAAEVATFVGTAAVGDFSIVGDAVVYGGPAEWSFRRLVLHYAHLCKAAGGVDAFLIGSELRGLTTLRSSASAYPFVIALKDLADDVRAVLGPSIKLSYGADWSEYFGHQPSDGSGDVFFHLDPLWSHGPIDFVGIDNYLPLADWRDGSDHLDALVFEDGRSAAYLRANVATGERFDWYYASPAARAAQTRSPITDGAYGKPWVFRPKDLAGWWGHQHFNRPGGVEAASPTGWVAEGKPIWFTELGCPAVDKGANQPNVFPDPKSSASAIPYFSSGVRDDLIQRRFLGANLSHFDPADPDHGGNPVSAVYGGRMVRHDRTHLWTWDARPFPAFPARADLWADGGNWRAGHWLNGRLGAAPADDLVRAILDDYGIDGAVVEDLDGIVDGYVIDTVVSARRALEPLSALLLFEAFERGSSLRVVRRGRPSRATFADNDFAEDGGRPLVTVRRAEESGLPAEIGIGFADTLADFRAAAVASRRLVAGSERTDVTDTGAAMGHAAASAAAEAMLHDIWSGRETLNFALPRRHFGLEPADIVDVVVSGAPTTVLVTRIEDGLPRRVEARSIAPAILSATPAEEPPRSQPPPTEADAARPEIAILDLPLLRGSEPPYQPRIAAYARPWPGSIGVAIGTADSGFVARQAVDRRATIGVLTAALGPGPVGRFDAASAITVRLFGGTLASLPETAVLNGGNVAAIGSEAGDFEVVQFLDATLIGTDTYRLTRLLRGQAGTEDVMAAGHLAGARFVLVDRAVEMLALSEAESHLGLVARCGPPGVAYDPDAFVDKAVTTGRRGLRCLAPARLAAARNGSGDVAIGWIRQTRIGGDAWEPVEVPLGEASEAYLVEILDGVTVVRAISVAAPSALYTASSQTADFGAPPSSFGIRVCQVSPTEGPGTASEIVFHG